VRPVLPASRLHEPEIPPLAIQPISAVPLARPWENPEPAFANDPALLPVAVVRPVIPGLALRRFVSPAFLVVTLLFLAMPCVEIRCNNGPGGGRPVVTQNGFQAAYGGYSLDRQLQALANAPPGMGNVKPLGQKERVGWAPLMALALAVLLAAIALGLVSAFRVGRPYTAILSGAAAFLFFLLLCLQMGIGFPIADEVTKEVAKSARAGPVFAPPQMNGFPFPDVAQQNAIRDQIARANADIDRAGALFAAMMVETRYSAWLWLACLLPLCSLAGTIWDVWPIVGRRFSRTALPV
jgi:hypothetical protein